MNELHGGGTTRERLIAGIEVDDAQASVEQTRSARRVFPDSRGIRTAVVKRPRGSFERLPARPDTMRFQSESSGDSAHGDLLARRQSSEGEIAWHPVSFLKFFVAGSIPPDSTIDYSINLLGSRLSRKSRQK
jgi:hypothetical protein